MIVEMGVCLEISKPVAVIFIEKCLLLALSLTPTSLAAAMSFRVPQVFRPERWYRARRQVNQAPLQYAPGFTGCVSFMAPGL